MVIEQLAPRFPQLYVAPAKGAEEAYKRAALRGITPEDTTLSHFEGSGADWLRPCETPAGTVEVVFLQRRNDFETFLRCIGHRCQPVEIPATIGAITYTNLADWQKIREGVSENIGHGMDAMEAFKATVADPEGYRVSLIAISEGPNSAVPFERTPFDEDEWLRVSREIRTYHELAHFVCRRIMPDDKPPILDEVTADFNGILHALGRYEAGLAALLLGVSTDGYVGGRLQEYLTDEQFPVIDQIAREVFSLLVRLEADYAGLPVEDSYDAVLAIKRVHAIDY